MQRSFAVQLLILWVIALIICFPVFNNVYAYTDENVQLWLYRPGSSFNMFETQGRPVADWLFRSLFSGINSIAEIKQLRLFSFFGWILCIPAWLYILRSVFRKEGLADYLAALAVAFLICTPVFGISTAWASCMELFIANTAGLLSGYSFYCFLQQPKARGIRSILLLFLTACLGLLALFTYQNGFGCFFLVFIPALAGRPLRWKKAAAIVAMYLLISAIYFFLFKWYLAAQHLDASNRTEVHIDLFKKLRFFFGRPLTSAFHFTFLFNEKSKAGIVLSAILFLYLAWLQQVKVRRLNYPKPGWQLVTIVVVLVLVYLPGLVVKESYASNRTMLALNMAVFILVLQVFSMYITKVSVQRTSCLVLLLFFTGNAFYNLHFQFYKPVLREYNSIRSAIESSWQPGVRNVYFIRPVEETFVRKYGITRSWDEYGVPGSFFEWVPEAMVKQVVFEKTGSRASADSLRVSSYLGKEEFLKINPAMSNDAIVIDAEALINASR